MISVGREIVWTDARKQNPKNRGQYLVVSYDYGLEDCPNVRVMNYGTSRKWDNGRDKNLPMEWRVRYWAEIDPILP